MQEKIPASVLVTVYNNPDSYIQELDGGVKIPLWRYKGQNIVPRIEYIEIELEKYEGDDYEKLEHDIIFVLRIIGLVGAVQGEEKKIPLLGDIFQDWFKSI